MFPLDPINMIDDDFEFMDEMGNDSNYEQVPINPGSGRPEVFSFPG